MSEILYYIFIFPLEQVLDWLLLLLYKGTQNYGISIMLLSLLVNLFLLKISLYTDKRAKQDGALKAKLDKRIKAWKGVYSKAKLYAFTQTLYRQHSYHPIYALRGLFGLALQIPFFIAILQLVNHVEVFNGVSFLWISDLSKPDVVAGIESLHLLPLIMTALTLINVFYSVQERGARIQGALIAILFLVLLYNMPSALVLYWSCNMAFSLAKEVVKKWRGKRDREFIAESKGLDSKRDCHTGKLSHNDNDLVYKVTSNSNSVITSLSNKAKQSTELDSKKSESSLVLKSQKIENKVSKIDSNHNLVGTSLKHTEGKCRGNIVLLRRLISDFTSSIFPPHSALDSKSYATYRDISIFAILNICFMICVFTPYAVYSSDVSQFDASQTYQTLGSLFGFFLLCSLVLIYITSFFYKTYLLKIFSYSFSAFLMLGVIYTFVLVGDYGLMNNFVLQKPSFPNSHTLQPYIITYGLLLCGVIVTHLFIRYIKSAYVVLFTTLCILSAYYLFNSIVSTNQTKASILQTNTTDTNIYNSEIFSYSKKEKNVVVFLLDMFSGSHILPILEQFPEFRHEFDGFTLFSNSISTTNATLHSTATIIGGEYYAVYNMNERNEVLREGIAQAFGNIGNTFVKNGYDVGYIASGIYDPKRVQEYNPKIFIASGYGLGLDRFLEENPNVKESFANSVKYSISDSRWRLLNIGIFRFAPEVYRHKIYRNGRWFIHAARIQYGGGELHVVMGASLLYALTHYNNVKDVKPTFKFLHFNMTHVPYGMYYNHGKCEFYSQRSAWNEYPHKAQMSFTIDSHKWEYYQHYDTEACSLKYLSDFISWLKEEEIYDNTQIFVVSDHSARDSRIFLKLPMRVEVFE